MTFLRSYGISCLNDQSRILPSRHSQVILHIRQLLLDPFLRTGDDLRSSELALQTVFGDGFGEKGGDVVHVWCGETQYCGLLLSVQPKEKKESKEEKE